MTVLSSIWSLAKSVAEWTNGPFTFIALFHAAPAINLKVDGGRRRNGDRGNEGCKWTRFVEASGGLTGERGGGRNEKQGLLKLRTHSRLEVGWQDDETTYKSFHPFVPFYLHTPVLSYCLMSCKLTLEEQLAKYERTKDFFKLFDE